MNTDVARLCADYFGQGFWILFYILKKLHSNKKPHRASRVGLFGIYLVIDYIARFVSSQIAHHRGGLQT
jgi:hypothetical protein